MGCAKDDPLIERSNHLFQQNRAARVARGSNTLALFLVTSQYAAAGRSSGPPDATPQMDEALRKLWRPTHSVMVKRSASHRTQTRLSSVLKQHGTY